MKKGADYMNEQTQLLIEIKTEMAAISQHLKDMNGKLVRHDKVLNDDCPNKHEKLDMRINSLEKNMVKFGTVFTLIGIICVAIINYVIPKILGGN